MHNNARAHQAKDAHSVLAVGAHPDDIELGCGGALLMHKAAGDRVTMLIMTDGTRGPGDTYELAATRRAEQEEASRLLGAEVRWGGFRDGTLSHDIVSISSIERTMHDVGADIVYVHYPDDSHQDHRAAARSTLSAARHIGHVLHYQSPSTLESFTPYVFVDINGFLDKKVAAIAKHASQVGLSSMVDLDWVQAAARYWGGRARVPYAEAFSPARMLFDIVGRRRAGPEPRFQPPAGN